MDWWIHNSDSHLLTYIKYPEEKLHQIKELKRPPLGNAKSVQIFQLLRIEADMVLVAGENPRDWRTE